VSNLVQSEATQAYAAYCIEDLTLYASFISKQNLYWNRMKQDGWHVFTFLMLYLTQNYNGQEYVDECARVAFPLGQTVLEEYETPAMIALRTKINNYGWAQKSDAEQKAIVKNLSKDEEYELNYGVLMWW
jgi:hypothetical protein